MIQLFEQSSHTIQTTNNSHTGLQNYKINQNLLTLAEYSAILFLDRREIHAEF